MTNLSYFDALPQVLLEEDKSADQVKILFSFILCQAANYNSFLFTAFVHIPTVIFCTYVQTIKMNKKDGDAQMLLMTEVALFGLAQHYLHQYELSVIVIEKHLILRQQTQIVEFF